MRSRHIEVTCRCLGYNMMHPSPWLKIGHPSPCPAQEASSSKHDQLRTALHLERSEDGVQIYDAFLLRWSSDKPLHFGISYWPRGASDVSDQLLLLPRNHFQASRCHHCHGNWKSLNIIENGTFNPKITELFSFFPASHQWWHKGCIF